MKSQFKKSAIVLAVIVSFTIVQAGNVRAGSITVPFFECYMLELPDLQKCKCGTKNNLFKLGAQTTIYQNQVQKTIESVTASIGKDLKNAALYKKRANQYVELNN